ncbi:FtsW/RodA/SpoVE family cell cycle protein [Salsipaludibacter albus]|uniref:FtsW/RodA/SpoVE family cell cycle protein n=1 Tax=Salsipaludibacter albus TaxID=2849650 RepID=UPI001EE4B166|nr:FtsW/RodA/SpoVE family cell cycle protein [Salsipaludibacter albus]
MDLTAASSASAERRLLVGAVLLPAAAFGLLHLGRDVTLLGRDTLVRMGVLLAGAIVLHLVVRRLAPRADPVLLPLAVLLNGLGLVMVHRIDLGRTPPTSLATSQATWTIVGIVVAVATLVVVRSHRDLTRYHYTIGFVTLVLLLLPLLPVIGQRINGAQLWVDFSRLGVPVGFQPGELAKIGLVIFLAGYLERKRALLSVATNRIGPLMLPETRHLGPVLLASGLSLAIVVFQRDLGSGLLFFGVSVTMLYIATGRIAYVLIGSMTFLLGAVLAWWQFGHVRDRVAIWLDPWSSINDAGWQLAQASFALGTGGLTGTGLGLGRPTDIPFVETDAIFAAIGEELGLLGATALIVVYVLMVARGYRIALNATDQVGSLLAAGLTTVLGLQVFVIIGGVTRLVPFTGITLPFVSYGGSSLVANYILLALLLRVSDDANTERGART